MESFSRSVNVIKTLFWRERFSKTQCQLVKSNFDPQWILIKCSVISEDFLKYFYLYYKVAC